MAISNPGKKTMVKNKVYNLKKILNQWNINILYLLKYMKYIQRSK